MRHSTFFLAALVLLALATYQQALSETHSATSPRLTGLIENTGQWPAHVLFVARQNGSNIWITNNGIIHDEFAIVNGERCGRIVQETLQHGKFELQNVVSADCKGQPFVTFIKGDRVFTCRMFSRALFTDVIPGVDVAFRLGADGRLNRTISEKIQGAAREFRVRTLGVLGPSVLEVTPPTSLVYGAYIGGSQADVLSNVDLMPNGDVIVAGNTTELTFPTSVGGYKNSVKGGIDAFVMRCDSKLQRIVSYTFFGGSSDERVRAMTIDGNNNVYICGETTSNDLPTTNTATSRTYKVGLDAFVAKFDSTLTKLLTGFYHGGNRDDIARGIAVDDNGTIVIAGSTTSTVNLPNTMPATAALTWTYYPQMGNPEPISVTITSGRTNTGNIDGFVATFNGSGIMQQSRYFGKEGSDFFTAVAFDKSSNVYLTGSTTSTNFETVPVANAKWNGRLPFDRTYNGGPTDAFVVKFNQNLTYSQTDGETFSTFLGGNKDEEARSIQVDALGRIYITGVTTSTNMPAIGTLATLNAGKKDAFYAQFGADGGDISGCTYFGGSGDDDLVAARIVPNTSSLLLYGTTESQDFPFEGQGAANVREGATDGFLSVISLGSVTHSTLIVGNKRDTIVAAIADRLGNPYYIMNSTSDDLAVHDSSFQKTSSGQTGFVGKLAFGTLELSSPTGGETVCVGASRSISWAALGMPDTTKFKIEYSQAGSGLWKEAVKSVGGRSYSWKVPALPNGTYVVRLSTIYGHVSELTTPFMISNPPSILTQPKNASACLGQPVSIAVSAAGAGLKFQWRKQGVNIAGATDSVYRIASLDANGLGKYECVVSGMCTPNVTSQTVTIASATPTVITTQPQTNVTVDVGMPFSLSVVAGGSYLAYQWFKNDSPVNGASTSQFSVASSAKNDEGQYTCEVTGGCGKVKSTASTVVVRDGTSVHEDVQHDGTIVRVLGPQPAVENVRIYLGLVRNQVVIARLIDMRGAEVFQQNLGMLSTGDHTVVLPVRNCSVGSYMLEIQYGATTVRRSVIVE
ncbi:MAG: hypothetical protein FJ211_02835 [Ignavibacteria bacterium]|nr:hypothetical protein [Ignavibacteria bacterium]